PRLQALTLGAHAGPDLVLARGGAGRPAGIGRRDGEQRERRDHQLDSHGRGSFEPEGRPVRASNQAVLDQTPGSAERGGARGSPKRMARSRYFGSVRSVTRPSRIRFGITVCMYGSLLTNDHCSQLCVACTTASGSSPYLGPKRCSMSSCWFAFRGSRGCSVWSCGFAFGCWRM